MYVIKTDSTNLELARLAAQNALPDGYTIYTYHQTAGRGQRGNVWESEPDCNLLFSTLICPTNLHAEKQFVLSQMISLAIKKVLDRYVSGISIKWPNDIYWYDKKIAGVLIENTLSNVYIQRSVVGVGINVNQITFTGTAPNPISLAQITGKQFNKEKLLQDILQVLLFLKEDLAENSLSNIHHKYMESLYRRTGFYPYQTPNERFEAQIVTVKPTGELVLNLYSGEERSFYFKEVSFVLE